MGWPLPSWGAPRLSSPLYRKPHLERDKREMHPNKIAIVLGRAGGGGNMITSL